MAWLVHEVAHVSQFQKVGIIYIIKALRAQRNGGYFYDESWLEAELKDFNFEQQAEIAKHFFIEKKQGHDVQKFQKRLCDLHLQKFC